MPALRRSHAPEIPSPYAAVSKGVLDALSAVQLVTRALRDPTDEDAIADSRRTLTLVARRLEGVMEMLDAPISAV